MPAHKLGYSLIPEELPNVAGAASIELFYCKHGEWEFAIGRPTERKQHGFGRSLQRESSTMVQSIASRDSQLQSRHEAINKIHICLYSRYIIIFFIP